MPNIKSRFETFNGGLMDIAEADERTITRTKIKGIRFGNWTAGVQRFWGAKTAGNKVDKLLSIPLEVAGADMIEVNDVAILENEATERAGQYQIIQIQPKFDAKPPALYLSLEKLVHPFKDRRADDG